MKQRKGVALLWAMITSAVILLIASVVATVVIKESRMTVDVENSTRAYSAAQSGVEWAKWYVDENCKAVTDCLGTTTTGTAPDRPQINIGNGIADVSLTRQIPNPGDRTKDYFDIESVGRNPEGTVTRKLFYKYLGSGFTDVPVNPNMLNNNNIAAINGSFSYMFDYWKDVATPSYGVVGFSNPSGSQTLGIKITHNSGGSVTVNAIYKEPAGTEQTVGTMTIPVGPAFVGDTAFVNDWTVPYIARFQVDYIKDTSLQVTFMKSNNGVLVPCSKRFSIDLTGKDISKFQRQLWRVNSATVGATRSEVTQTNMFDSFLQLSYSGTSFNVDNFSLKQ